MPPTRDQLLQTGLAFISSMKTWTLESVMELRSPKCIHRVLPGSVNFTPQNNDEFAEYIKPMLSLLHDFEFEIVEEDTMVDEVRRKVLFHLKSSAQSPAGVYANEYFFAFTMDEQGTLVDEVIEFVDSGYTLGFVQRLKAASAK